ncbi:hypothetical protein AgCh_005880 [Apium graveolens]
MDVLHIPSHDIYASLIADREKRIFLAHIGYDKDMKNLGIDKGSRRFSIALRALVTAPTVRVTARCAGIVRGHAGSISRNPILNKRLICRALGRFGLLYKDNLKTFFTTETKEKTARRPRSTNTTKVKGI